MLYDAECCYYVFPVGLSGETKVRGHDTERSSQGIAERPADGCWEVPVLWEGTAAAGAEAGQAGLLRAPEEEPGTRTSANEIHPWGLGTGVARQCPSQGTLC